MELFFQSLISLISLIALFFFGALAIGEGIRNEKLQCLLSSTICAVNVIALYLNVIEPAIKAAAK